MRNAIQHSLAGSARLYVAAAATIAIAVLCSASGTAHAADAYLCDGGRVVYVELADLERMKRTDACIAGYYGLSSVDGAAASREHSAAAHAVPDASTAAEQARPAMASATPPPRSSSPEQFAARKSAPARRGDARPAAGVALPVRTIAMTRPGSGAAPVAAPATDYRNVRVLNGTGREAWYRHEF